jgi:hypothetical protein
MVKLVELMGISLSNVSTHRASHDATPEATAFEQLRRNILIAKVFPPSVESIRNLKNQV